MKKINGGICAPKGFSASGVHSGLKKNPNKKDLALIISETDASTACTYTQNLVKGAPIYVTKENLLNNNNARAIIVNSGNANTCNDNGIEVAREMCELVEKHTGISNTDVVVASTGVIGQKLNINIISDSMKELIKGLGDNSFCVAEAIMTTDTIKKEIAYEFKIGDKICRMGGVAKGSGMIHPNMATMLVFICTDVCIDSYLLQKILSDNVKNTFNMISVDGDTSTNDMVTLMANGCAGNDEILEGSEEYLTFKKVLLEIMTHLCKQIAKDGEGATKLIECKVNGALDKKTAQTIAKSVICSPLVKSAMFGSDANWGRILCAIGYAGVEVDVNKININLISEFGEVSVCENGKGVSFSEEIAKKVLRSDEIIIDIILQDGDSVGVAWGCDLTYDYVKINGSYRT